MTTFYAHHAIAAVDAVRRATSGYGPPQHDPLSRRPKAPRAERPPRRRSRVTFAALRPVRAVRRTVARAPH
jgi:hypothetical protein